ncbi:hypothetical protein KUCAC02_024478, partial [Chaenocephalus aceratus]
MDLPGESEPRRRKGRRNPAVITRRNPLVDTMYARDGTAADCVGLLHEEVSGLTLGSAQCWEAVLLLGRDLKRDRECRRENSDRKQHCPITLIEETGSDRKTGEGSSFSQ